HDEGGDADDVAAEQEDAAAAAMEAGVVLSDTWQELQGAQDHKSRAGYDVDQGEDRVVGETGVEGFGVGGDRAACHTCTACSCAAGGRKGRDEPLQRQYPPHHHGEPDKGQHEAQGTQQRGGFFHVSKTVYLAKSIDLCPRGACV